MLARRSVPVAVVTGALAFGALAAGAITAAALAAAGLNPAAVATEFLGVDDSVEISIDGLEDVPGAEAVSRTSGEPLLAGAIEAPRAADLNGSLAPVGGSIGTSAPAGIVADNVPGSGVTGPTSSAEVSASAVSAPVAVSADALWSFDSDELTIVSTITSTIIEVDVGLRGHQAEIDRCAGPVVSDYGAWGKVIGEHNHCGGAYVLELEVGDVVRVTGHEAGSYVVAFLRDVPKKNTPVTVLGGADLFLQTCHFSGGQMRLAALTPQ